MTKRDAWLIAAVYAAWLSAATLINIAASGARTPQAVFESWVRFDGIYFRAIAEFGYAEASQRIRPGIGFPFLAAFFPVFPLLIRAAAAALALAGLGFATTAAAVIVPQILTLLALLALFKLVTLDFSRSVAWLTVLSLIAYPTFYFLTTAYSETVFLLLVIVFFYWYRTGKLWRAGIAGACATAARIMGAPFLLGTFALDMVVEVWRARRGGERIAAAALTLARRNAPLALIPLGLLAYMAYLSAAFGDPLLFMQGHASSEWKVGFDPTGPIKGLLLPFATLFKRDWSAPEFRANMFNALFLYVALAVAIYGWRKLPRAYSLYALLAIFVPMLTGSLISMPRYLLVAFPFYMGMGIFFAGHPRARVLIAVQALGGFLATYLFFRTVFLG